MRNEAVDADLLQKALRSQPNDLFYTRALMPRAVLPDIPPPIDTQRWFYCMGGQTMTITGTIFTDGSAKCPMYWPEAYRAAGWPSPEGVTVEPQGARPVARPLLCPQQRRAPPRAEAASARKACE